MKKNPKQSTQFAVCTDNSGYLASLEVGKLYPVIPDAEAAKHGYIRVIDESGDDYGYATNRFFILGVPAALAEALRPRRITTRPQLSRAIQRPAATRRRAKA